MDNSNESFIKLIASSILINEKWVTGLFNVNRDN
jgi:hypothetical protein